MPLTNRRVLGRMVSLIRFIARYCFENAGFRLEVDPSFRVFRKIRDVTEGEMDGSNRHAIQA